MSSIVDLELDKSIAEIKRQKTQLLSLKKQRILIEKGYDNKLGARPLRRAVEKYLEDTLAEELLSGNLEKNKPITVILSEDEEKERLCFEQEEKR